VSAERVLVDTSIWVDYFRGGDADLAGKMDALIMSGRIGIPAVVLAEMIQGAGTEAEIKVIVDLRDAFAVLRETKETWLEAGKLSQHLRKKGKSVHLTDCYIAIIARENDCAIFTRDAHFRDLREILDFELL